jgi:uncharacterized membrane protein (UPF0127 family)
VATRAVRIVDDRGSAVARAHVAASFGSRLRGLLGRSGLPEGEALLIPRTSSIHTHFMRFPIDAVFRDWDGRVVAVERNIRPWRFARARGAADVLELAAGECDRLGLEKGIALIVAPLDFANRLTPPNPSGLNGVVVLRREWPKSMRLTLNDPKAVPALLEALRAGECLAEAVGEGVIDVLVPWIMEARDARQALMELHFFARTWEALHPGLRISLAAAV